MKKKMRKDACDVYVYGLKILTLEDGTPAYLVCQVEYWRSLLQIKFKFFVVIWVGVYACEVVINKKQ